jgi:SAM-dependent methyltransferase
MLRRAADRARAAGVAVDLVIGDLRDFSLGRRFGLVIVPFNTFLMVPPDERRACLARIRKHLAPDGLLALDVFQPDPSRIAGVDGGVVDEGSAIDRSTGDRITFFTSTRATVDRTTHLLRIDAVGADGIVHRLERVLVLHFLYRREAELLLDAVGFEIVSLHGDHEGTPADEHSARLLVVGRRLERGQRGDRRR